LVKQTKMKTLIIGKGEIGTALYNILKEVYFTEIRGRENLDCNPEILHICYPYSEDFIKITQKYIQQYQPKFIVIHSTVPIGTTRQLGENVWHSPIRGIHPQLEKGLKTFTKYVGGKYNYFLDEYFLDAGIQCRFITTPENSEALKLWDTTQYGVMIMLQKEIYKWCKENNVDFNIVYTYANQTYNKGYKELDMEYVNRPILKQIDGKIGGHCVMNNAKLLDSWVAELLLQKNEEY